MPIGTTVVVAYYSGPCLSNYMGPFGSFFGLFGSRSGFRLNQYYTIL